MPARSASARASSGVTSGADQLEHRVAPGLHVLAGDKRLEIEAQQGLGIGGADVEMPVWVVDRDAVQPRDLGLGVGSGDLGHLGLLVGDLGVDLAGDEVALAKLA